jgi:hypothetical protein
MYCYFYVHLNIAEEIKLRSLLNLKNENGTHHAVFAYSKLQVQYSRVTEWLEWNIATRILIRKYKLCTTNKTFQKLDIFVSRNPWHPFAEP